MDNNGHNHMPFVHPSRAHLFKQPPISDNTFKHTSEKVCSNFFVNLCYKINFVTCAIFVQRFCTHINKPKRNFLMSDFIYNVSS